jgi:hypothetical protein
MMKGGIGPTPDKKGRIAAAFREIEYRQPRDRIDPGSQWNNEGCSIIQSRPKGLTDTVEISLDIGSPPSALLARGEYRTYGYEFKA